MDDSKLSKRNRLDPLVSHAGREALLILLAFAVCLIWSVSCCYLLGYGASGGGPVATVLGIPSWVLWGVLVPWLAADVFALWFCFFFMADDPLSEAEDETAPDDGLADRHETRREDRRD